MSTSDALTPNRASLTQSSQHTHAQHDALVDAMHRLERALGSAAPGREREWNQCVTASLQAVADLLEEHVNSADADDGLLADMVTARPALMHRVERLRHEHQDLLLQARALHRQFAHVEKGELPDFRDVRHRTTWLLNYLRHHQAAEADLMFEAFSRDVGIGD